MRGIATTSGTQEQKISRPFVSRIDHLGRGERIRAVVLLREPTSRKTTLRSSAARAVRRSRSRALPKHQEGALTEVDKILKEYGGERVSAPNALGGVVIEATALGILALAKSEHVKAIFEDQALVHMR